MAPQDTFHKQATGAPPGFFAVEAAGLAWLGEATGAGGVRVADVRRHTTDGIVLARLRPVPADACAAEAFGRALAATHRAGAPYFGCPPGGWPGDGFIGPLPMPHVRPQQGAGPDGDTWAPFYARYRLQPFLRRARDAGHLSASDARAVEAVCARLADPDGHPDLTGPAEAPARIHGDLWSGNVMWTADGAVLIDPAAHGGHRETDLAMLTLFGLPFLERVLAAYDETWPLADGWRRRVPLHQLHPLLVHAALFGGGYGARAVAAARQLG